MSTIAYSINEVDGTYTGELLHGAPHGQGTFTYVDSPQYDGPSKDETYAGKWEDGKQWKGTDYDRNGNVTYTDTNGVAV